MGKINEKDIAKRWTERIVANGWQNEGRVGAMAYLEKYGRNISCDKVQAIADYARKQGCEDFAVAMEQVMK